MDRDADPDIPITKTEHYYDREALAEFLKKNDVDGNVEDFGKAISQTPHTTQTMNVHSLSLSSGI